VKIRLENVSMKVRLEVVLMQVRLISSDKKLLD